MKVHQLSFGEITILNPNLAEVIISEGIVMDLAMVGQYHAFLLKHLQSPFSLLINKKFSYTYTFEAQKEIASLDAIDAMAVVTETFATKMATKFLISMNEDNDWNIKLFRKRDEALDWLNGLSD